MGWQEFQQWLDVRQRQLTPVKTPVDSWAGREHDPFWQKVAQDRANRYG